MSAEQKQRRRKRYGGTTGALKALVGSTPRNAGPELACAIHLPREFVPLLRPDGPFCGSGL